jgi:O-antigen ligase
MDLLKGQNNKLLESFLMLYVLFLLTSKSALYFPMAGLIILAFSHLLKNRKSLYYPAFLKQLILLGAVLLCWQTITLMINGTPVETLGDPFRRMLYFSPLFVIPLIHVNEEKDFAFARRTVGLLLIAVAFIILLGVFQNALEIKYPFPKQPYEGKALVGFFPHHIDAGGFFSVLAILSLCLALFWQKSKRINILLLLLSILFLTGVFLSLARTYYISLLVMVPAVFMRGNRRIAIIGLSAIIVFVVAVFLLIPHIRERALSVADLAKNTSNLERLYIWKTAGDIIKDHPVSGIGFRQWRERFSDYSGKYARSWKFTEAALHHAHNLYLTVAAETGIVGLFLFTVFWAYLLMALWRCISSSSGGSFENALALGIFFGLVNFLIGGLFEDNLGKPVNISLISFLSGLVFSLHAGKTERPVQDERLDGKRFRADRE